MDEQGRKVRDKVDFEIWYGPPGIGKSTLAIERNGGDAECFKMSNYECCFWDGYKRQKTLICDEFSCNWKINYCKFVCDKQPLNLNIKYAGGWAQWTMVIFITNCMDPENEWYQGAKEVDRVAFFNSNSRQNRHCRLRVGVVVLRARLPRSVHVQLDALGGLAVARPVHLLPEGDTVGEGNAVHLLGPLVPLVLRVHAVGDEDDLGPLRPAASVLNVKIERLLVADELAVVDLPVARELVALRKGVKIIKEVQLVKEDLKNTKHYTVEVVPLSKVQQTDMWISKTHRLQSNMYNCIKV
ncbi:hypothetical protein T492DRAFT_1122298 [Pavlovales sp. CCMP2436]|nr:hypothetical protein T492DRAFT_1122298 [Pavlovales sp. CCMP2436]